GIGEDADYLDGVAREAGVAERVHRLGHVPMEDLPRWYNACDVFVLANREIGGDTEGFGMVFLEAAACGKAAIAGRAGGTGSAVLDGVTGLRVDASTGAELVDALARLLDDPPLLESMGQAGLARVRQSLSWQAVAERTRNCLRA
ncbi:MAG: glycosyltransferase family 4 protein, partial [Proteobacteria bacterium]|nr:glycosyltransferase family 4 protein [Pseudomonadota bacterium]